MRRSLPLLLSLLLLLSTALLPPAGAEYSERLTLRPLPGERKAAAHLHASVRESFDEPAALFPPALARILDAYDAEALHLSLALGRYSHARFGREPAASAPSGARLQVDLRGGRAANSSAEDARRRWRGITSELGGVFSASLRQMDEAVVVGLLADGQAASQRRHLGAYEPADGWRPGEDALFLHGSLAREELCSENLSPWLKLLPCRSTAGLGRLVDPVALLSGEYLALTVFASRSLAARQWTMHLHLTAVQRADPTALDKASRRKLSVSPTLRDLFLLDDDELAACPLADRSVLVVDDPVAGKRTAELPVSASAPLFPAWTQPSGRPPLEDLVHVHRFATGVGQVRGGLAVRLTNRHEHAAVRVQYHDVLPWFLRVYFSSLRVLRDGGGGAVEEPEVMAFEPAELRGRPNQLHVELVLPARSSAVLTLQFDKAFLRLSEHPPDANRGFDVAPGVTVFSLLDGEGEDQTTTTTTLFTEPLLVPLPTPDFSMPYNVITMTSTVVAFFVGSMLNSLLRKAPRIKQLMARPAAE